MNGRKSFAEHVEITFGMALAMLGFMSSVNGIECVQRKFERYALLGLR
jgi:hypothetical protein